MKSILVPTDFSECSINALNYAASLSKFTGAKIYLLHVYQVPVPATDVPVIDIEDSKKMEKDFSRRMHHVIKEQKEKHGWTAEVSVISSTGITFYEINHIVKDKKIDLIVMGMRGETTVIDKLFGSNTTEMVKKAICPLLLVPEDAAFHVPDRIAIAFDFNKPQDLKKVNASKEIAQLFNSKLFVFSIIEEKNDASEKAVMYDAVKKIFEDVEHSIHFNVNHDLQQGILSFIDEHKAKMLVMFHHSHNIFARMFTVINSKEISFRIKVPLMVINEKVPA